MIGRKKPYTAIGIRRLPCCHCSKPAVYQWNACAIGNRWVPLCADCDIAVNEWFLTFAREPDRKKLMAAYREKVHKP